MPRIALTAWLVYVALAFGYRSYVQYRRTRHTGFVGFGRTKSLSEKLAGALFASALALGLLAPLWGMLWPSSSLGRALWPSHALPIVGLVLYLAGLSLTLFAQLAMGDSWRIGVAADERTALVTGGPFRIVRNPIFSAMLLAGTGLVGLYASPIALAGYLCLWLGLELQVRVVEEPYLQRIHGEVYRAYVRRTGRFVPGIGRSTVRMSSQAGVMARQR